MSCPNGETSPTLTLRVPLVRNHKYQSRDTLNPMCIAGQQKCWWMEFCDAGALCCLMSTQPVETLKMSSILTCLILKSIIFFSWLSTTLYTVIRKSTSYRVSHCKVCKVDLLCWGYRFWFLLMQRQNNKNWWIRHKWPNLMNT